MIHFLLGVVVGIVVAATILIADLYAVCSRVNKNVRQITLEVDFLTDIRTASLCACAMTRMYNRTVYFEFNNIGVRVYPKDTPDEVVDSYRLAYAAQGEASPSDAQS